MNDQPQRNMNIRPKYKILWLMLIITSGLNVGCASTGQVMSPNDSASKHYWQISVTRTTVFSGDIESVFQGITPENILPQVLTGYGPIPAVSGTTGHEGDWGKPGAFRIVQLTDGTSAKEQLTHFDEPSHFAYRVWDFDNKLFQELADGGARGEWKFEQVGDGTAVQWTYSFYTSSRLATIPLSFMAKVFWRGYMDVCLNNYHEILDA
ncbi:MAG: SRPBCC family protein [Marinobacter sp.]|nr:SRPBCC family protein [Marinobacter sp.]